MIDVVLTRRVRSKTQNATFHKIVRLSAIPPAGSVIILGKYSLEVTRLTFIPDSARVHAELRPDDAAYRGADWDTLLAKHRGLGFVREE